MANEVYQRLSMDWTRGALFAALPISRTVGRGGARHGAGRPKGSASSPRAPRKIAKLCVGCAEEFQGSEFVKRCQTCVVVERAGECAHPKPRLLNGKERKYCYSCRPKPTPKSVRKEWTPKVVLVAMCGNPECGAEFIRKTPTNAFCSSRCRVRVGNTSDKHREWSKANSGGGHRRRVRSGGGLFERFDALQIFARDRWSCRACGIQTPAELRGTFLHNAPELDHDVPVSRGGDHTIANAQCLCRSCNILKSNRTMAEFVAWLAT